MQEALELFGGTILLVSHDRYLINRLASQIWDLRDGRLNVYTGGYQNYLQQRDQEMQEIKGNKAAETAASNGRAQEAGAALSKNEQRLLEQRLQALEDEIHRKEQQLAEISAALQDASHQGDVDNIRRFSAEYADLESHLSNLLASWEEAHE